MGYCEEKESFEEVVQGGGKKFAIAVCCCVERSGSEGETRMYVKARMAEGCEQALLTNHDKSSTILEKLRHRAEQVGFGCLVCEIQVHQGQIKQVDITAIKERMRAD